MLEQAKNYIVFPLDVPSLKKASALVQCLDGHVGMFKIGLELFIQEGPAVIRMIRQHSDAGIFLDLKLHDISVTVGRAMARVADLGVDLVTVHCSSSNMLKKAVEGGQGKTGVLGVTLLTDNDQAAVQASGFESRYVKDTEKLVMLRAAMAKSAGCRGIVCSGHEVAAVKAAFGDDFLAVTPGIRPEWTLMENDDQKRVVTPAKAIASGSDLLVIGRPIRDAENPVAAAQKIIQEIKAAV